MRIFEIYDDKMKPYAIVTTDNENMTYEKLKEAQAKFKVGEDLTTDAGKAKVEAFKQAQIECNRYAAELNKVIKQEEKAEGGIVMAVNISNRKGNVKNKRSHALNATKTMQKINLQVIRCEDGSKKRISTKEKRTLLKNQKAA